jgi:NADH-quinone oxidoreductase subunit H
VPDGFWITLVKSLVLANLVMAVFAVLTWVERRLLGRFQNRLGPNRVGPFGLLQPIADLVKLIRKESLLPEGIHPALYLLAPVVSLFASLAVFAVIPFGGRVTVPGTSFHFHLWISDPSVGLLVVFGLGSVSFYGFLVGGWSSASKYSLFGSMRAVSQLVSYEVSLALAVIGVVMMSQTLSLTGIVAAQKHDGIPYVIPQFLGFAIYVIASTAEVSRIPFDLPEAEGELVAGYHTEYGGMRWAMFQNAEYVALIAFSAVASVLFFGGPAGPAWLPLPGPVWMLLKMAVFILLQMWVRGTLPRVRYDHLMTIGWKLLLPAATLNLLVTSAVVVYRA